MSASSRLRRGRRSSSVSIAAGGVPTPRKKVLESERTDGAVGPLTKIGSAPRGAPEGDRGGTEGALEAPVDLVEQ